MRNFFAYYEDDNTIGISSVGFGQSAIFFRQKDFIIRELFWFDGSEVISLLSEDTEPSWVKTNHHLDLHDLFEIDIFKPVMDATIELENNGKIIFDGAQLFVTYPPEVDIKQDTMKLLESMGYYASEEIFEFCRKHPGMHLLEMVFGMNPEELTDEFESILAYSKTLDN